MSESHNLHICMLTRAVAQHQTGGGMELHAEVLRHGLVERGHRVTVITTPHATGVPSVTDAWGETHFVGTGAPGAYSRDWWTASLKMLMRLHARDPFDVIASQGKAAYAYLGVRKRLPVAERIPTVIITHNTIIHDARAQFGQLIRRPHAVARWAPRGAAFFLDDRRRMPLAEAITALTAEHASALRRWFTLDPSRVVVIPNGVDVAWLVAGASSRGTVRAKLGVADDSACIVLELARLIEDKGQRFLLDAVSRIATQPERRDVRVVLAGDGPARDTLATQVDALGLREVVTFLGRVPHEDVPGLLAAADIVALPSFAEGMPLSLLEAMVCGRPVVASNIPAIASFIEDGVTGRLVPVAEPAALARTLDALIADRQNATKLGERARAFATERYDQKTMVADYERIFARVASVHAGHQGGTAPVAESTESPPV